MCNDLKVNEMRKGLITVEFGELVNLGKDKFNPMTNANMPCIELEHIDSGTGTINGSVDSSEQKSLKNVFHKGDILFSKLRPYLRKYWFADFDGVCSSEIWVLKPKEIVLPQYLFYLIQTEEFIRISNVSSGSKMPRADWDFINHYPLTIIHSLPEQHRIVSVLFLWDTAIAKQTALIEKLTLRKRGLMQQLLTGKKRLKGFEGEWKELRLGEIGMFLSNNTLSRDQLNPEKGEVQNVHYGDVLIKYPSILDCSKTVLPFINENAYKDSMTDYVKDGDIIISDTAEDETVGKACEIQKLGNKKVLAGLHTMLLRPKDGVFAPFFLGYYFNSEKYHSKLLPLIQGIKVCSIGKQAIQNTIIEVPSIEEQTAIASVLVNADKEIEIQKQKLAAMQEQKKGLMQVLLTGKKRVKTPSL